MLRATQAGQHETVNCSSHMVQMLKYQACTTRMVLHWIGSIDEPHHGGPDIGVSPLDLQKCPNAIIQEATKIIAVNRRANLHAIISTLMSHNAKTNDDRVQEEDPVFFVSIKDELTPLLESGRTRNSEYLQECHVILLSEKGFMRVEREKTFLFSSVLGSDIYNTCAAKCGLCGLSA